MMLHSLQALLHNMYFCTFVCFRCFCMCTVQYLTNKIIIYLNTNFTLNIHILCTFVLLILWTIGHKKYEGSFWVWHHENFYPLSLSFFASEVGRGDDPWHETNRKIEPFLLNIRIKAALHFQVCSFNDQIIFFILADLFRNQLL